MSYRLTLETRKGVRRAFLPKLGRYAGRDGMEWIELPTLARGVKVGPVTLDLAPGLYWIDTRKEGGKSWFLVSHRSARHEIAPDILSRVRAKWEHFARHPCDIPCSAMGDDAIHIPGAAFAWVAEIVGRDPKFGLGRSFLSRVGGALTSRFYLERGRLYQGWGLDKADYFLSVAADGSWDYVSLDSAWEYVINLKAAKAA